MEKTSFNVPSISCSSCSGKIQEGIKSLDGVNDVSIDLKSQAVAIDYDPENIQPQDIKKKISSMGYEIF